MEQEEVKNSEKTAKKRGRPFQDGQSGNPNGRPKGSRDFVTIYREAMKILADKNSTTVEQLEAEMVANAAILARKGDFRFYKDTMDRLHGSPVNRNEHGGVDGADLTIKTIVVNKDASND